MINSIPPDFDESFLRWFQQRTEEAWQHYETEVIPDMGTYWQQGTCWSGGLSEQEIARIEHQYQVRFPPDYRLFLQVLHSVDRPMVGCYYPPELDNETTVSYTNPSFYNWLTDTDAIQYQAHEWLAEGLLIPVRDRDMWFSSWGAKPGTLEEREARVRELVNAAPKLIPVYKHRYLLAEPCQAGNPVLSIWGTDMVIYNADLRRYLLHDFSDLVGTDEDDYAWYTPERYEEFKKIPFWGEFFI